MKLFLCFVLIILFVEAKSQKVLLFLPGISNSQALFTYRLADVLTKGGLNVTVFKSVLDPDANKGKLPEGAKEIRYEALTDGSMTSITARMTAHIFDSYDVDIGFGMEVVSTLLRACENTISDQALMKQLADEKFDLAVGHMYDYCPLGIIKHLGIPSYAWMGSAMLTDYMAWYNHVPCPTSYVPNMMSAKTDSMTFLERFQNFYALPFEIGFFHFLLVRPSNQLFQKYFGPDFPPIQKVAQDSPLVFVNSEELFDFPRPILHKTIYVGGFDANNPQPLDKTWNRVMQKGKKGVILFSLGTVAKSDGMPVAMRAAFVGAFKQFADYQIIMKFDGKVPEAEGVPNIMVTKWAPQRDLLDHPRTVAFVTHGGYNSLMEAINSGVPMIAIPLFGDQMGNQKRMEKHKVGIGMSKIGITADSLASNVRKLLTDPSYTRNAKTLKKMIAMKPSKPKHLVVEWMKFLAEFKSLPNFQTASVNLYWFQYWQLDVIFVSLALLYVAHAIVHNTAHLICRKVCGRDPHAKKKSKKSKGE